jgi:hypothetical protein
MSYLLANGFKDPKQLNEKSAKSFDQENSGNCID